MPFVQFRVHPGVGCARMGNSENVYYLASEFPQFMQEEFPHLRLTPRARRHPMAFFANETDLTVKGTLADYPKIYELRPSIQGKYKEDIGTILPQATRFRVFAYVYADTDATHPDRVFEVTSEIADIRWSVNVANKKSAKKVGSVVQVAPNMTDAASILDTATDALVCNRIRPVPGLPTLAYLFLEPDDADRSKVTGRLHVIGNEGELLGSGDVLKNLWANDWYDGQGDGYVEAAISPKGDGSLFRQKVGAAGVDDLRYLEFGSDIPREGTVSGVRALPGWVVIGCPDYVPEMGHFVSLWDCAFSRAVSALDSRQARPQTGRYAQVILKSRIESYLRMDYLVHIHPQLCLFEDVRYVSGEAFGKAPTADRGHNKFPSGTPPQAVAGETEDKTSDRLVAHGGMRINARTRKVEYADPSKLKDFDPAKPIADWLKIAIYKRLRKPGTLYDKPRQFIVNPPFGPDQRLPGVFPRKVGRRLDYDKAPGDGSDKDRFWNMITYKYPPGNLRKFHGFPDTGKYCGGEKSPPAEGGPWSSLSADDRKLLDFLDDMYWPASFSDMPMLRELAYTFLQYDQFGMWQARDFVPSSGKFREHNVRTANLFDQIVSRALKASFAGAGNADAHFANFLAERPKLAPAMIDMAGLGAMLGGSFYPGIEVGREAGIPVNWSLYHGGTQHFPDVRFRPCNETRDHTIGTLTKDLSVPWTVDYRTCDESFWPTSRPGMVFMATSGRQSWFNSPKIENSPNPADDSPGDTIPHLGRKASGEEYIKEYWKSLLFIRRRSDGSYREGE